MNQVDKQYIELIKHVLSNGSKKEDRTGTGTLSVFDYTMRFNLAEGFPLLTTKKLHFKSIAHELLFFLSGKTNNQYLKDNGVKIWDQWALKEDFYDLDNFRAFYNGELGPIYSKQWTAWGRKGINQVQNVIDQIKNNPDSRRIIVSAWNVDDLPDEKLSPQENIINGKMALAPCHAFFQFYVNDNKLSCKLTQRSSDIFIGLPYNIASYALLTHMIAQQCNLEVGELIWSGGDVHIYQNHLDQVNEQIKREPFELPKLNIKRKPDSIFDYQYEDFEVLNYKAHPSIKAKVAV